MFKFDDDKFIEEYGKKFGPMKESLANAIKFLLKRIEADERFTQNPTDRYKLAYSLATFKWETAHTLQPIDEYGSDNYFNKNYGPQTSTGKRLGNTEEGDGARFHGRGFVQLTGRSNYRKAGDFFHRDLESNPELAKDPDLAYDIALEGMSSGWFTGKKLSQFIKPGLTPDYEGARTIINGHDKAQTIADIARRMDELLEMSLEP
ncbi:glycoside hydrolase family 19 protein [Pseudomonas sp. NPDC089569]|uniref:glycoside hydrolase family 19 protein n=1 Tax=Pseudomonas sp. NPDC089569 TaxID=3390722 RepID=UPI003D00DB1D